MKRLRFLFLLLILPLASVLAIEAPTLHFEVRLADGFDADVAGGRVLVVLGPANGRAPRQSIGNTGMTAPPVLGADAKQPGADRVIARLDDRSELFPIEALAKPPAGNYQAQAVVHLNRDLNYPNAPGDLFGPAIALDFDPRRGGVVKLEVNQREPAEQVPADRGNIRYLKFPSKLLSEFHGRPMYYRAAVVLPRDYDKNPDRKYPLRVHIGGYGMRYASAGGMASRAPAEPQFLTLVLDGAGPFGDPYQVDSANNGPYGAALTQELIPHVERTFRGIGTGHSRFTDGHSTGGWVSLALQVFYPDYFNGCWSFCPDPVDFRDMEVINIYRDENAYVNRFGFERPAKRLVNGDVVYTVRHECQIENVLGRGNRWPLSGKDWGAWNATFGPRGPDGLPVPLWDGKTGKIDRRAAEHWAKFDLRKVMQDDWSRLGPKLRGKLHIYSGDCDDYFLNNAVRKLDSFLKSADPPADASVTIGPYASHNFHPLSEKATLDAMWAAYQAAVK